MVSNLLSNTLESHAQVFPTLTEAQIRMSCLKLKGAS